MPPQIIRWYYAEAKPGEYHINFTTEIPNQSENFFSPEAKDYSAVLTLLQDPRSAFWDPDKKIFSTDAIALPPGPTSAPTFRINWYLLFWRKDDRKGAIVLHGEGQTLVLDGLDPNPFIANVLTLQTGQTAYWRNLTITTSRGAVP